MFLNGPPYSGKDTVARFIRKHFNSRDIKFSWPLKHGLRHTFALSDSEYHWYEQPENKDTTTARLGGLSWRQAQIKYSEEFLKPTFGDDVLGKIAVEHLNQATSTEITTFSDSGFFAEHIPVIGSVSSRRCLQVRLSRDGCSFTGDSRNYVDLGDLGVKTVSIQNDYPGLDLLELKVQQVIGTWMSQSS